MDGAERRDSAGAEVEFEGPHRSEEEAAELGVLKKPVELLLWTTIE